ncbi:uncharacterized protein PAC_08096 [Phialocephala subalpina]|uniref:NDT80 domain-containing protein n=1 Tax=Phialocephala subalpina TaxID=576137 RepID=A0A1L7WZK1_9HELO|nr:uncharacterized protein PAC_08096 [Phialocephala subalpina]
MDYSLGGTACPPLSPTDVIYSLQTSDGQVCKPEIFGRIDKGFFMVDNDWTCYHRNYFALNCSFTLTPILPRAGTTMYLVQHGGAGPQVHGFTMSIAAVVDSKDGKSIELIQRTPKRDKGPQEKPARIPVAPRPAASHEMYRESLYDYNDFNPNLNRPAVEATFERIQFKNPTIINGKRRAAQRYYHLLVELFADIGGSHSSDRWVKIASRMSAQMVVRGRSLGHYQNERRGSNSSSGPGGSGGGGAGSYTPSGGASRTPGDMSMSGSSSMLPGSGSSNSYDTRYPFQSHIASFQNSSSNLLDTSKSSSTSEPMTIYVTHPSSSGSGFLPKRGRAFDEKPSGGKDELEDERSRDQQRRFEAKSEQLPDIQRSREQLEVAQTQEHTSESSSEINHEEFLEPGSAFETTATTQLLQPVSRMRTLKNNLKRFFRSRPQTDHWRVEWICECGDNLYADFQNGSDDAVNKLATILQSPGVSTSSSRSSTGIPLSGVSTSVSRNPSTSSSASLSPRSSTWLPPGSASSNSSVGGPVTPNQSYLEVCVNTSEYTKTLSEIDLRDVGCDGELFHRIRKEYLRLRGFRSRFWLLKPSGVHFVRFSVEDPLSIVILQKPFAPPPHEVLDSKNYSYSPCTLEGDPPIPQHLFLHYFSCTAYNPKAAWLPRLPKKLDSSILRFTGAVNYGWGIHINEGPDYFIIGIINFVLLALSGLAAFLWNWYHSDFQGAFGFAGWIVAVVNGVLVAYVVKWQQE